MTNRYFTWLLSFLGRRAASYKRLLHLLHDIPFYFTIEMDGNREEDGMDLRYRFAYEKNLDPRLVATMLDWRPASVLEVMVALAIRCEDIMTNPVDGDRTNVWFWDMVKSLGIYGYSDSDFDEEGAREHIEQFLRRDYDRDGRGGLFTIHNYRTRPDIRNVEIWAQAMWYLDEQ